MADLLFLAVREDLPRVETLAEVLAAAGLTMESAISEAAIENSGAVVVVWSRAAIRSKAFMHGAEAAFLSGKAIVACLSRRQPDMAIDAPCFDLSAWKGDPGADVLDDFFYAVYSKAVAARHADEADEMLEALEDDDSASPEQTDSDAFVWWEAPPAREDAATVTLAWSSDLPEKPLPVPQSRRPKRKRRPGRALLFAVRAAGVALLIGAAVFAEAVHASAPRLHDATPTSFAAITMDFVGETVVAEWIEAASAPPASLREPASAPRS